MPIKAKEGSRQAMYLTWNSQLPLTQFFPILSSPFHDSDWPKFLETILYNSYFFSSQPPQHPEPNLVTLSPSKCLNKPNTLHSIKTHMTTII